MSLVSIMSNMHSPSMRIILSSGGDKKSFVHHRNSSLSCQILLSVYTLLCAETPQGSDTYSLFKALLHSILIVYVGLRLILMNYHAKHLPCGDLTNYWKTSVSLYQKIVLVQNVSAVTHNTITSTYLSFTTFLPEKVRNLSYILVVMAVRAQVYSQLATPGAENTRWFNGWSLCLQYVVWEFEWVESSPHSRQSILSCDSRSRQLWKIGMMNYGWVVEGWLLECVGALYRVGVFATLTNSYALVATGGSMNFYRYVGFDERK